MAFLLVRILWRRNETHFFRQNERGGNVPIRATTGATCQRGHSPKESITLLLTRRFKCSIFTAFSCGAQNVSSLRVPIQSLLTSKIRTNPSTRLMCHCVMNHQTHFTWWIEKFFLLLKSFLFTRFFLASSPGRVILFGPKKADEKNPTSRRKHVRWAQEMSWDWTLNFMLLRLGVVLTCWKLFFSFLPCAFLLSLTVWVRFRGWRWCFFSSARWGWVKWRLEMMSLFGSALPNDLLSLMKCLLLICLHFSHQKQKRGQECGWITAEFPSKRNTKRI